MLKPHGHAFEKLSINTASEKTNLMREVHTAVTNGLQVKAFFTLLEVGYLIAIVVNFYQSI